MVGLGSLKWLVMVGKNQQGHGLLTTKERIDNLALKSDNVTEPTNALVVWPQAQAYLRRLASREYRLAAKGPNEFDRGRRAGRGEMCEELLNLPEALSMISEEDDRADANVKG